MSLRFGDFVLDPGPRQLRRGEEERHFGPKAFELLELLLRQRPNVVTKEAIHDRLWPGTFVSASTLATVVGEVRSALDDDAWCSASTNVRISSNVARLVESPEEPSWSSSAPATRAGCTRTFRATPRSGSGSFPSS
jgi:hypothetical protein